MDGSTHVLLTEVCISGIGRQIKISSLLKGRRGRYFLKENKTQSIESSTHVVFLVLKFHRDPLTDDD